VAAFALWEFNMPLPVETLAPEILGLPSAVRSALLDRVVASLDADAARDAAWDHLAAQREVELADGTVQPAPLDEVLARLRSAAL
jgi:hypothetical protein